MNKFQMKKYSDEKVWKKERNSDLTFKIYS